jgi:hypothetical protein
MVDRIPLIQSLSNVFPTLKPSAYRTTLAAADKLVTLLLGHTPLPMARACDEVVKTSLAQFLHESAGVRDLKVISKLWDPQRSVAADISNSDLARDLADLLCERRYPYAPTTLTLAEARALDAGAAQRLKRDLQHFASLTHVKAIKKRWDKHAEISNTSSVKIVEHLCALLDGTAQPVPPPPPAPRRPSRARN